MFLDAPTHIYLFVILGIVLVFVLARKQIFVDNKQYLKAMIQHHSSAILTSEKILEKTNNRKVEKLAKEIIESQQKEIREMNDLIKELDT